eukprot:COSAG04_NODE_20640_length_389_cov_0.962069_1_plen_20_part_10
MPSQSAAKTTRETTLEQSTQ